MQPSRNVNTVMPEKIPIAGSPKHEYNSKKARKKGESPTWRRSVRLRIAIPKGRQRGNRWTWKERSPSHKRSAWKCGVKPEVRNFSWGPFDESSARIFLCGVKPALRTPSHLMSSQLGFFCEVTPALGHPAKSDDRGERLIGFHPHNPGNRDHNTLIRDHSLEDGTVGIEDNLLDQTRLRSGCGWCQTQLPLVVSPQAVRSALGLDLSTLRSKRTHQNRRRKASQRTPNSQK